MLDFFTKPSQGILYELFRNMITVHSSVGVPLKDFSLPLKDCVENQSISK